MNDGYKTATLSMIAKAAGVSIATASRVLNRNDAVIPISARTKESVLKTARQMGYLPSMAARACTMSASMPAPATASTKAAKNS